MTSKVRAKKAGSLNPILQLVSGPVLRDTSAITPPYCALWGFWCRNMTNWVRYPPSPFAEPFPLGEHAKWRCDTPPQRGISAILARYHMKTRQNGCDTPSAILSRIGIARYGGGILHWAAKCSSAPNEARGTVQNPPSARSSRDSGKGMAKTCHDVF